MFDDEIYGENEQLYVTYAYGEEMWKRGYAKGLAEAKKEAMREQKEKDCRDIYAVLTQYGFSEEEKEQIVSEVRSAS